MTGRSSRAGRRTSIARRPGCRAPVGAPGGPNRPRTAPTGPGKARTALARAFRTGSLSHLCVPGPPGTDETDVRASPGQRARGPHGDNRTRCSAGPRPAEHLRERHRSARRGRCRLRETSNSAIRPGPDERAAAMAQKAIVGEKVGMTQVWAEDNRIVPVTVLKVEPARIVQVKTTERDGYTAVQVTYGNKDAKKLTKPAAGHYAKAGVARRQASGRAAPRLGRRLRGRPGDRRRRARGRPEGRRHGGQPGQGLRRHDEASQLRRSGSEPR